MRIVLDKVPEHFGHQFLLMILSCLHQRHQVIGHVQVFDSGDYVFTNLLKEQSI